MLDSQLIGRQVNHMDNLVDVRDVVANAVEQVTLLIRSRRLILPCTCQPDTNMVRDDEKRLVQIIALAANLAEVTCV